MAKNQAYLNAFGRHLKKLIEAKGLTPEDVAAHGNLETKQVYRAINGEHSTGLGNLYALAKGLGVKMGKLFEFEFDEEVG